MNDKRNPEEPTATAPDSVEESVYEEADHAGKDGKDAADPPTAARKSDGDEAPTGEPGADLDVDEGADAFETHEEAREAKPQRDDVREDEDIISLDSPD